jgi:hypothetical protein
MELPISLLLVMMDKTHTKVSCENTDELEAEQPINIQVLRRASNFSYPVRVSNDSGDYADITLVFDNTLGNNDEGFLGYN